MFYIINNIHNNIHLLQIFIIYTIESFRPNINVLKISNVF